MDVKSVYNFIPAPSESEVFTPDWAEQVSLDIPFSDGESGEIELTITAKTPIFIRNGHSRADKEAENEKYLEFSNIDRGNGKEYFIPATSIKGMIRNVLEIMSFSRMKQVGDDIFSFRALNHKKYKNEVALNKELKTGWLLNENGNWKIYECSYGRIDYTRLNKQDKTSKEKYELTNNNRFQNKKYSKIKDLEHNRGILYEQSEMGAFSGYIVFFGSMHNKKYEYVFTEPNSIKYNVKNDLIKRFEDIDDKLENTLWQYLESNKNPYPKRRIPVFFSLDENDNVKHFGFSRLYKMSNTKYLNELEPLKSYYNLDEKYELDLAEIIFGTVEDTNEKHGKNRNKNTLKGRVFFGHAFAEGKVKVEDERPLVLGSPKASYFPFYLKDNKTYLEDKAELKGFKKYPLHKTLKSSIINEENKKIETTIKPLAVDTIFTCKIRFHNLRKVEIGALLSALTFHGMNDLLDHNIGSAKPLGYGKISISNVKLNFLKEKKDDYLANFEKLMQTKKKQKWLNSDALRELYAMSIANEKDFLLKYPEIELENVKPSEANEFANYIKANNYLNLYSELQKVNDTKFVSVAKRRAQEIEKEKQKEIEEQNKKNDFDKKIREANSFFDKKYYKKAKKIYEQAKDIDIKFTLDIDNKIRLCNVEIEQIKNQYNEILSQADTLFKEDKWQEALDLYLKVIELQTDEEYPKQQKNKCKAKLNEKEVSLDSLSELNSFDEGRNIIQQYCEKTHNISEDDKTILKKFIFKCYGNLTSKGSITKFLKFNKEPWKLLKKYIGKPTAQKWYNQITKK